MKPSASIAAVLAAGVLLAAVVTPVRQRIVAAIGSLLRTDSDRVATELAALLRDQGSAVGAVEVSGSDVILPGGPLRLSVAELHDSGSSPNIAHFHVLTGATGAAEPRLDACVVSTGTDQGTRLRGAATAYVALAFPALWSQVKSEGLLSARRFHGDEAWGVPGFRGFAGAPGIRGHADTETFAEAALFSGLPRLPADGRPHLLKAVLEAEDGAWWRTIELDGDTALVSHERLTRVPAPASFAMVVWFAVFDRADALLDLEARRRALLQVEARPPSLFPADACPADVMPADLPELVYSDRACLGGRLADCLRECERGSATSCYSAALELQRAQQPDADTGPLFLRSCGLGNASACTNAASGRAKAAKRIDDCSLRTFEDTCERAGDPWGCTMAGAELSKGELQRRDPARARRLLGKSCRFGAEDPACATATSLLAELDAKP